jgi:phosphate acetyltransferase
VLGAIVNRLNEPIPEVAGGTRSRLRQPERVIDPDDVAAALPAFGETGFALIGAVPWDPAMVTPRVIDVAHHLDAEPIHAGEWETRRVVDVAMIARTVRNMTHRLRPEALVVAPGDRDDVLVAACMAALNGVPLAGIVLTGGLEPGAETLKLCERAFATGLPLLAHRDRLVRHQRARAAAMNLEVPIDDVERMETVMDAVAARSTSRTCASASPPTASRGCRPRRSCTDS